MKTNKEIKRLNLLRFGAKWAVTLTSSLPLLKALHRVRSLAAGCFSFLLILSSLHGAVPPEPQAPPPDDAPGIKGESAPTPAKAPPGSRAFQPAAAPAIGGAWQAQGPGPTRNGQVENIVPNNEVAGSIHALAPHPTDASILFAGAVNGGVWRTRNATASSPNWTPLTDELSSLSIGALAFDPTDPTHNTLVAGVGRHSSFAQRGGPRTGIQRTTDGGDSWVEIDGAGVLLGKNVSGIAARGSVLMVAVNVADVNTHPNVGLFRSTDTGVTFTQVSGSGSGLPLGLSHDLAGDRHRSQVLYTDVSQSSPAGGNGIYKSTDSGANWVRVSSSAMDALITSQTSNIEIAVGTNETVYVGIINGGRLMSVFRSGDGGATWVQMDTPATNENGTNVGVNPNPSGNPDPGGQGSIHFSIVADPTDTNLVYVGGDRQPLEFINPTSIGATDFSGRLFRGNASQPAGSQWVHLTHSSMLGAAGGGTASSSSPHADSRDAEFDANGVLIEGNDGGIYKRTSPRNNTGDWFSICGDIQPTEFHNIAYDANARVIAGGAQDTGTPREIAPGGTT